MMSEMKKIADGWNRVLDLVTRQGVDRRQNYWSSIMFMSVDKRQNTDRRRTYKERRKK
tara:strand:- start:54 stop:227 length:174 start_codon:yes stop_codon:yes gene_type:complete